MKTILWVDDEGSTLSSNSTYEMLEAEGFKSIAITSVLDVIPFLDENGRSIDAIVLDMVMPPLNMYSIEETKGGTMTGLSLLQEIHARVPGKPIIVLSVLSPLLRADTLRPFGVVEILSKPKQPGEIARSLKRILHIPE